MEGVAELHINIGLNCLLELIRTYSVLRDTDPFSCQQAYKKHGIRLLYFGRCSGLMVHRMAPAEHPNRQETRGGGLWRLIQESHRERRLTTLS
jgi:hypothetical protein